MKIEIGAGRLSLAQLFCGGSAGRLVLHGMDKAPEVRYICTDSREAGPDTLLIAIRGERVDGHRFLAGAAKTGCTAFLVDHIPDDLARTDTPWAAVVVDDTVAALPPMSAEYRRAFLPGLRAVGVTGSVGKTTVKELTSRVMSHGFPTYRREGNNNSVIGLPLSVMEIDQSYRAAVLEMGMSARGEISAMARAVQPDICLITNVGSSHLEHLGTRENIARAKLEVLDGLRPGGCLIVPADEPLIDLVLNETDCRGVTVLRVSLTDAAADVYVCGVEADAGGSRFSVTVRLPGQAAVRLDDLTIPAPGAHMVYNAALAAAAGAAAGVSADGIRAGLASYKPAALRQSMTTVGGVTLLEDCYNAAPESMRAALGVLAGTAGQAARRIAVLGDMRELGADTVALHRGVGAACRAAGVDVLITVGALGAEIAQGALDAGMPAERVTVLYPDGVIDAEQPAQTLLSLLRAGDTVLFKASRALALERVSAAVRQGLAGT